MSPGPEHLPSICEQKPMEGPEQDVEGELRRRELLLRKLPRSHLDRYSSSFPRQSCIRCRPATVTTGVDSESGRTEEKRCVAVDGSISAPESCPRPNCPFLSSRCLSPSPDYNEAISQRRRNENEVDSSQYKRRNLSQPATGKGVEEEGSKSNVDSPTWPSEEERGKAIWDLRRAGRKS